MVQQANETRAMLGEKVDPYTVANPHPLYGKDDNIANEYGHTHYPKFMHKFDDKGEIVHEKFVTEDEKGVKHLSHKVHESIIVNNEDEEAEAKDNGFIDKWVAPPKQPKKKVEAFTPPAKPFVAPKPNETQSWGK